MSMISKQVEELNEEAMRMHDAEKYAWSVITQRAADTIADLSVKVRANNLHGGWIPCSDRLPETGDSILVTYSDEEVGIVWSARPKLWGKYEKANNLIFPVAWMPLPEPYREEREV